MEPGRPDRALELPEGSWWDWEVLGWDAGRLMLAACYDLTYLHGLELVFHEPLLVGCPTSFCDPVFRAPTADELARLVRQLGEEPPVVVAFETDGGGTEPVSCLIAAERLEIVQETVLRYWRADAAPGQRYAPWVRPPGEQAPAGTSGPPLTTA
uniref:CN hydrolase domain-containing protein n=1 Tax=Streptomyces sp. NBC_00049 TaxID=2903617 RepID=A0AAU2JIR8_9ACTN